MTNALSTQNKKIWNKYTLNFYKSVKIEEKFHASKSIAAIYHFWKLKVPLYPNPVLSDKAISTKAGIVLRGVVKRTAAAATTTNSILAEANFSRAPRASDDKRVFPLTWGSGRCREDRSSPTSFCRAPGAGCARRGNRSAGGMCRRGADCSGRSSSRPCRPPATRIIAFFFRGDYGACLLGRIFFSFIANMPTVLEWCKKCWMHIRLLIIFILLGRFSGCIRNWGKFICVIIKLFGS